jgi:arylsulfatase A-like enzyme
VTQTRSAQGRPNIILILADDLGYGDLACYGNDVLRTPHIDRLASEGVRCSQHYTSSPLCAPARGALLTGRYNHRVGALSVESNRGLDRIALREQTLGDVFSAAGYATGYVGKWHSGLFDLRHHPNRRGFAEFAGFLNGIMDYWDWIFDYNGQTRFSDGRYQTDVLTQEAVDFIDRHASEPFFLHLAYHAPHTPLQAPEEDIARYQGTPGICDAVARLYAMIDRMDQGIGQVLAKLDSECLTENTLVLFTSDNGPWLGGHNHDGKRVELARYNGPFRGMKQDVLEGGIRVPAIVRWPAGLPAGTECHDMIHFCDWLPTLSAAAGATPNGRPLDGVDAIKALSGGGSLSHVKRFWQHNRYDPVLHCNMAMRDGNWKLYWPRIPEAMVKLREDNDWAYRLVREPHRLMPVSNPPVERELSLAPTPQLYDLSDDPLESTDLAVREPERVLRMSREADAWFESVERDRVDAFRTLGINT